MRNRPLATRILNPGWSVGSNNRQKAKRKVARVHSKISRCREDFLHKLSRKIVNENQVIAVENFNVKGNIKGAECNVSRTGKTEVLLDAIPREIASFQLR